VIASMFLSAVFGLMVLAVAAGFVLVVRRWHRRELGGAPEQWDSVRKIMARRERD
jgi:cobalamin synthase